MEWIRVDTDLLTHRKTILGARILDMEIKLFAGYLLGLWFFVMKNAWRDGDLRHWGPGIIEDELHWKGEPGVLVKAFQSCGYLDGLRCHGWHERASILISDRLRKQKKHSMESPRKFHGKSMEIPGKNTECVTSRNVTSLRSRTTTNNNR